MNYQRIYNNIIEIAKLRGLNKKKLKHYIELHHIVPRCLNGLNDKSNLVLLTGREHYLCHWLLWKINKNNKSLFLAYHKMVYQKRSYQERNFKISSKQYEILKTTRSKQMKENNPGGFGKDNPFYGKKHSEESRLKIKAAWIERRKIGVSDETKLKMSLKRKGKFTGKNNSMYGKKLSAEHSEALHSSTRGNLNKNAVKCSINNIKFDTLKFGYEYAKNDLNFESSPKVFRRYLKQRINGWFIIEEVNNE